MELAALLRKEAREEQTGMRVRACMRYVREGCTAKSKDQYVAAREPGEKGWRETRSKGVCACACIRTFALRSKVGSPIRLCVCEGTNRLGKEGRIEAMARSVRACMNVCIRACMRASDECTAKLRTFSTSKKRSALQSERKTENVFDCKTECTAERNFQVRRARTSPTELMDCSGEKNGVRGICECVRACVRFCEREIFLPVQLLLSPFLPHTKKHTRTRMLMHKHNRVSLSRFLIAHTPRVQENQGVLQQVLYAHEVRLCGLCRSK